MKNNIEEFYLHKNTIKLKPKSEEQVIYLVAIRDTENWASVGKKVIKNKIKSKDYKHGIIKENEIVWCYSDDYDFEYNYCFPFDNVYNINYCSGDFRLLTEEEKEKYIK